MISREILISHLLMLRDHVYSDIVFKVIEEPVMSKMISKSMTSLLTASTLSNIYQLWTRPRGDSQDTAWARLSNSHSGMKRRNFQWLLQDLWVTTKMTQPLSRQDLKEQESVTMSKQTQKPSNWHQVHKTMRYSHSILIQSSSPLIIMPYKMEE